MPTVGIFCNKITSNNSSFGCPIITIQLAVVDAEFSRGGGATLRRRAPTYDFAKFPQKLHEIERIWIPGPSHWLETSEFGISFSVE